MIRNTIDIKKSLESWYTSRDASNDIVNNSFNNGFSFVKKKLSVHKPKFTHGESLPFAPLKDKFWKYDNAKLPTWLTNDYCILT